MEEKYKNSIEQFNEFVKQYDMNNEKISKKYYHTFRVADYAKEIAIKEDLNEQDIFISYLCGLLHDIARFRQAKEYNTFHDIKSFDHGDLGYEILKKDNYISCYIQDKESQDIILKAVKNHNKYAIEDGLNERELLFAKIIRDADKIDILDKLTNDITDNSAKIDDDVIETFLSHKLYKNKGIRSNDVSQMLKYLCFIFDINFKSSINILKENNIVERKLSELEKNMDKDTMKLIRENIQTIL